LAHLTHGRFKTLTRLRGLSTAVGDSAVQQLLGIAHHRAQIVDELFLLF
jgi:hypothetical protein